MTNKDKRVNNITKEKLIKLFEDFGYKTTSQSSDGTYMLLRYPDGISTNYWIFSDRVEHRDEHRDDDRNTSTCSYFSYKDCFVKIGNTSLSIIANAGTTHGVFAMFFNYKQPKEQSNDQ